MILLQAVQSFYSRSFYHDLARKSSGAGVRFIVFLTLLSILFLAPWKLYTGLALVVEKIPEFSAKLPAVTYKDQKLSIDRPVPYSLKFGPVPKDYGIVIDTNYKINDVDALAQYMKQNHIILLLTQDKMATMKGTDGNELDIRDLKNINQPFAVSHQDWMNISNTITAWGVSSLLVSLLMMFAITFFIFHFLATVVDGIVVSIFGAIFSAGIDFGVGVRLAAAARIPIVIIAYGLAGKFSWLAWLFYLGFAAYASKREPLAVNP